MKCFLQALFNWHRELLVYCIIGCSGATLDFVVYAGLASCLGIHYQFSNFIGVTCGIINNYLLNYFLNFNVRDHFLLRLTSFYGVGMFGCAISAASLWILIGKLSCNTLIAKLIAIFLVTTIQFCLNKALTFRQC